LQIKSQFYRQKSLILQGFSLYEGKKKALGDFSLKAHTFLLEDQPNCSKQDKDGFSGT